jgi:RNA polymerase sigma-32 factor
MERRLAASDMSLDAPVRASEQSSTTRIDLLTVPGREIDDALADEEVSHLVGDRMREFGKTLTGKEERIYHARMLAEDPLTLQELGHELGVSRERVRQLERRVQLRLKEYLADAIGEEVIRP